MAAPDPVSSDPCGMDITQPVDTEQESAGPAWWRYIEGMFVKTMRLGHACNGKHFYGVDSGSVNAYVVDVGSASQLVTNGLYAGMFVYFIVGNANTGASTLQIKSGGTNVGSTSPILYSTNPTAVGVSNGAPVLSPGELVLVVFDGTSWNLIGGENPFYTSFFGMPPGTKVQIGYQQTGFSAVTGTTSKTSLGNFTFASNSFTKIEIEADVQYLNGVASAQSGLIELDVAASSVFTTLITGNASGDKPTIRIRWQVVGGQSSPTVAELFISLSNAGSQATLKNISIVGIK